MGSNVLPQALVMVPKTSLQCAPKKLAFSTAISRRPSAGALICTSSHHSLSLPTFGKSCSFIVRAEANAEVEVEVEVGVEESAESEVTQIVPSEEKSPRKPRIKLGDIMGGDSWLVSTMYADGVHHNTEYDIQYSRAIHLDYLRIKSI